MGGCLGGMGGLLMLGGSFVGILLGGILGRGGDGGGIRFVVVVWLCGLLLFFCVFGIWIVVYGFVGGVCIVLR